MSETVWVATTTNTATIDAASMSRMSWLREASSSSAPNPL